MVHVTAYVTNAASSQGVLQDIGRVKPVGSLPNISLVASKPEVTCKLCEVWTACKKAPKAEKLVWAFHGKLYLDRQQIRGGLDLTGWALDP